MRPVALVQAAPLATLVLLTNITQLEHPGMFAVEGLLEECDLHGFVLLYAHNYRVCAMKTTLLCGMLCDGWTACFETKCWAQ